MSAEIVTGEIYSGLTLKMFMIYIIYTYPSVVDRTYRGRGSPPSPVVDLLILE
jgi:hypothetical protein